MIIGINGYIGSGKDTVGKIIQYLVTQADHERRKFNGDLRLYEFTSSIISDAHREQWSGWQIKKFAGKLKQIASLMLGVPVEKFEDQEFKKTELGPEWSTKQYHSEDSHDSYSWMQPMTVREFLQRLGTEAIRHGLHSEAWVNTMFADYKPIWKEALVETYPNWIITDMRFPNEMKAVKDRGGITVRVNRTLAEAPYQTLEQRHPSETSLDGEQFDHIIENNGTIDELTQQIRAMLQFREIIPVYPANKRSITFERDNGTRENWNAFQNRYPESTVTFEAWYDDHVAAGNKQVTI